MPSPAPAPVASKRTNWETFGFADPNKKCRTAGCLKGEGHLGLCTPDEGHAEPAGESYSFRRASSAAAPAPVPEPAPKRSNWELFGFADPNKQCRTAGCLKGEGHLGLCTPDECPPACGESYSLRR